MSFNRYDEQQEEMQMFLDYKQKLDEEMKQPNPSKSRVREILQILLEIL